MIESRGRKPLKDVSREQLKKYRDVVMLWANRYDTAEIGKLTNLPESLVARWVANFRETVRTAA